jgi:hypothetical protein
VVSAAPVMSPMAALVRRNVAGFSMSFSKPTMALRRVGLWS